MSNKKPTFNAVVAREGKDGKRFYTTIGAAWPNSKGGYSIRLNALPLTGEILLFPPKTEENSSN